MEMSDAIKILNGQEPGSQCSECLECPQRVKCFAEVQNIEKFIKKYLPLCPVESAAAAFEAVDLFLKDPTEERHDDVGRRTLIALQEQLDLVRHIRNQFGKYAAIMGFEPITPGCAEDMTDL